MSIPRRHHHNPIFLLQRWADPADGKICVFRRLKRKVVMNRYTPRSTGYEQDLYAVMSRSDPAARQDIELNYLQRIDNNAARALARIESPEYEDVDRTDSEAWGDFLLSLYFRNPRSVTYLRELVAQTDPERFADFESEYQTRRRPEDPPNLATLFETADQSFRDEAWASLFIRMLRSQRMAAQISQMRWAVIRSEVEIVVGDDPLLHSNGMNQHDSYLALPIGPDRYFIAANNQETINYLGQEAAAGRLARAFNRAQADQAVKRVFALKATHKLMLRKHLCAKPPAKGHRQSWLLPKA